MRAVNLLPREIAVKSFEAKRGVVFGGVGGFALLTVALGALYVGASGSADEQRTRLDTYSAELAAMPRPEPDDGQNNVDAALAAEKNLRITALSGALSTRIAWDRVLRQISQVLPDDVWLTTLESQQPEAPAPGTTSDSGVGLVLSGSTYSHSGVARFLSRLAVVPALGRVQLVSSTTMQLEPRDIVQFTINATVRPSGGAS
jgi:Tfp pilus assembly protein PilN